MEEDLCYSLEWAKKAAKGGDVLSQYHMEFFDDEIISGILSSTSSEAILWHKKAANQ